jgi:CxxC motif-containing protein (DUF1111 family)
MHYKSHCLRTLVFVGALLLASASAPGLASAQQLPATATASSVGPAGNASQAVDGNQVTRWESAHGVDPSWLTLDLGASYALSRTVIHWEAANAEIYNIDGSQDNTNWVTLSSQTGGQFGDHTDDVNITGSFRYVRMYGIQRSAGNQWGYSIWEMEVYGVGQDSDGDGFDTSLDCDDSNAAVFPGAAEVCGNGIDDDCDGEVDDADVCALTTLGTNYCVAAANSVSSGGAQIQASGSSEVGANNLVLTAGPFAPGEFGLFYHGAVQIQSPFGEGFRCVANSIVRINPPVQADGTGFVTRALDNSGDAGLFIAPGTTRYFQCWYRDPAGGDVNGDGDADGFNLSDALELNFYEQNFVPLFDDTTPLQPELQQDTPTALITRLADRARDRHAREDEFQIYDHYLSFYWEHRTADIEIVDTIGKGGNTITFNVATQWPLSPIEAELRFFYRGITTVAEYHNNGVMSAVPALDIPGETIRHYTRSLDHNPKTNAPLQVGDRLEFELSQFLTGVPNGRNNYYGTAILYIVGQGVVPWEARGVFGNHATDLEDSFPMPQAGLLGGNTTLPYQYSDEPDNHFMQMPTNLAGINGQKFVLGRRVHHTDFGDGSHDEAAENASFAELAGTLGTRYVNRSCIECHQRNGRALPPAVGQPLRRHVVRVGDASGAPNPMLGSVLQPLATQGASEGDVVLASWTEANGLRSPNYSFSGAMPTHFGARIAAPLVGIGLLEAIVESDIEALADPDDLDGDGISGRMRLVSDVETGETRIGRFGWKASQPSVKHQVAAALNTDMGVMTSIMPQPDCGSQQPCDPAGPELAGEHLDDLTAYISLLGVSARRNLEDAEALFGETLFNTASCSDCHVDTFQTTPYHPHAELRDQTIHPYTDLLLHDMGSGLASTLIEGNAVGNEWRTAPLWNIGLANGVAGGEAYLHDGRARTLHEAIMWHGGESEAARLAYASMTAREQQAIIAFLRSL